MTNTQTAKIKLCKHDYKPLEQHFINIRSPREISLPTRNVHLVVRVYCTKCLDIQEVK